MLGMFKEMSWNFLQMVPLIYCNFPAFVHLPHQNHDEVWATCGHSKQIPASSLAYGIQDRMLEASFFVLLFPLKTLLKSYTLQGLNHDFSFATLLENHNIHEWFSFRQGVRTAAENPTPRYFFFSTDNER